MNIPEAGAPTPITAVNSEAQNGLLSHFSRRRILGVVGAAAVATVGYLIAEQAAGDNGVPSAAGDPNIPGLVNSESQAANNCSNIKDAQAASNHSLYGPEAFLPDYSVKDPEQAKQYILDLFSENGPLADNGDKESFAAMMATVVDAAHQGGFENTNYDYISHFNTDLGAMSVANCKKALSTLIQDVGYNSDWANPGETITQFAAQRDQNYNITNAALDTGTASAVFQGIELKFRTTSKDQNGFLSVLISTNTKGVWNGNIYIKGLSPRQVNGASTTHNGHKPQKVQPNIRPLPNGTANGFSGNVVSRSSSQTGAGRGLGVSSGPASPESLPSGPNTGKTGTGPSHAGGPTQSRPGPGPSPGPGGGGHGGGPSGPPPTETAPPPTQTSPPPTETAPPPTTTTTPPTTTTTPTPTTKGPNPCDPSIAKC